DHRIRPELDRREVAGAERRATVLRKGQSERLGQQLGRQLGTVPEHVDQRLVQARGHAGGPSRGRRPHRRLSTAPAVVHSTAGPPGSGVACPPVAGSDTAVPSSAGGARSVCAVIASGWVATARFRYGCTV